MCRKGRADCEHCKLKPDESRKGEVGQMGYFKLKDIAANLVHSHQVLTKNEVPAECCPYYVLRFATETAKYVFTVVHNIDKINIMNRLFTIINEDPTLDYFFPSSPELARVKSIFNEVHITNNLVHVLPAVDNVIEQIELKKRKPANDKTLLHILEKIKDINDALASMKDQHVPAKEVAEKIKEMVLRDYKERSQTEILEILTALDNCHHPSEGSDEIDLRQVVTALLVPFVDRPIHGINAGNGYRSMHLIGDARVPRMDMEWVPARRS